MWIVGKCIYTLSAFSLTLSLSLCIVIWLLLYFMPLEYYECSCLWQIFWPKKYARKKKNETRITSHIKPMERTKCAQKLMLIACNGYERVELAVLNFATFWISVQNEKYKMQTSQNHQSRYDTIRYGRWNRNNPLPYAVNKHFWLECAHEAKHTYTHNERQWTVDGVHRDDGSVFCSVRQHIRTCITYTRPHWAVQTRWPNDSFSTVIPIIATKTTTHNIFQQKSQPV